MAEKRLPRLSVDDYEIVVFNRSHNSRESQHFTAKFQASNQKWFGYPLRPTSSAVKTWCSQSAFGAGL